VCRRRAYPVPIASYRLRGFLRRSGPRAVCRFVCRLSILRHSGAHQVYNPSIMRRRLIAPFVLLILALVVPGTAATRITIATGPWGGVYFWGEPAMAHLLSKHIPGSTAIAEPATGSAHSLELVHRGEATHRPGGPASGAFGV